MTTILIVEDDPELSVLLSDYLKAADYHTHIIDHGDKVIDWFAVNTCDLVILDLMLPGKDGLTIFKELRAIKDIPIVMATAKVEEIDRLLGLELGADDYICKPYSFREVVARAKLILRRTQLLYSQTTENLKTPEWIKLNTDAYQLFINGQDIHLTAIEFSLFNFLYKRPGKIFSRDQIIDNIYKDHRVVSGRTVDTHIKKIRKKILAAAPKHELIHSIYGVGYKLEIPL